MKKVSQGLDISVSVSKKFNGNLVITTKHFDDVKSAAKYAAQARKDCHNLNFVLTDDPVYNTVINDSVDNVYISIVRVFRDENLEIFFYVHVYEVYRPCIFVDDDNNFSDLNK